MKIDLDNILKCIKPSELLYNADTKGLLESELSELYQLKIDVEDGHKDNYHHTLKVMDNAAELSGDWRIVLLALVHDLGKPISKRYVAGKGWTFHNHEEISANMLKPIMERHNLDMSQYDYIYKLVLNNDRVKALSEDVTDSAIRRLITLFDNDLDYLNQLFIFSKCDMTTKYQHKIDDYRKLVDEIWNRVLEIVEIDRIAALHPVLDGHYIMDYYNIKGGREVGMILKTLKNAIIEGEIENTFDACKYKMLSIEDEIFNK